MGGSSGQTQTQSVKYPPEMKGFVKNYFNTANKAFQGGVGLAPPPVIGFSGYTTDAMKGMSQLANNNRYSDQVMGGMTDIFRSGGMAPGTGQSMNVLGRIANGDAKINTGEAYANLAGQYGNVGNNAMDPTASQQNLQRMAAGKLIDSNPYVDQMVGMATQSAGNQAKMSAAMAGRGGSGIAAERLGYGVAGAETELRNANYEAERARQLQANQMLDEAGFNQIQAKLSALAGKGEAIGGQTNVQGTNIANKANAAVQGANIANQGYQNMLAGGALAPQLNNMQFSDFQRLMGLGGMEEAKAQQLAEQRYYQQNAPLHQLGMYSSILSGGSPYTGRTITQGGGSPLMGAMGGAMGGGVLGNMLFPGIGGAIGAGLGGLGGFFM